MVMGVEPTPLTEKTLDTFTCVADLPMDGHYRFGLLTYTPSGLSHTSMEVDVGS